MTPYGVDWSFLFCLTCTLIRLFVRIIVMMSTFAVIDIILSQCLMLSVIRWQASAARQGMTCSKQAQGRG